MTALLLGGLVAALAAAAPGQADPPTSIRPSDLRHPTPALAARLLGRPASQYSEVEVSWPGNNEDSTIAHATFVSRARATGWSGLCQVDYLWVILTSDQPRRANSFLGLNYKLEARAYAVLGAAVTPRPEPSPSQRQIEECRSAGPLLNQPGRRVALIGGRAGREAEPAEAAFALAAFAAARASPNVIDHGCAPAFDPRCRDLAAMVRDFDVREIAGLGIRPCRVDPAKLCVVATYPGSGRNQIMIVTEEEAITHESGQIRIRAVCVTAANRMADLRGVHPC